MENKKGFHVDMENGKHDYYFDGKKMTGVTTVLSVISKPALIGWAARMTANYIANNWDANMRPVDDIDLWSKLIEDSMKAHAKKRDKAAESGTDVHLEIEGYIKECIEKYHGYVIPKLKEALEGKITKQTNHFITWALKNAVKFLESEKVVYDKDLFLAGTADFVCEIDGKKFIGDIKTSSSIYGLEPFAQCAAYAHMLDYKLDGTIIINLKKSGEFDEEKDVYFRFDLETDWKFFEAALTLYRLKATWKK